MEALLNISPIDGRYHNDSKVLDQYLSEYALIKYRTTVEVKWLIYLAENGVIPSLSKQNIDDLNGIIDNFSVEDGLRVKEIESVTKHDVKAVEYLLREKLNDLNLSQFNSYIHITLTSEDINNTAYNLMLKDALNNVYLPTLKKLTAKLNELANQYKAVTMLGHTHGQNATPTTVGKEFKIFEYRINSIVSLVEALPFRSKFSGATGNYNCQIVAYPEIEWIEFTKKFVESLGLQYNPLTTQIESHDFVCILLSYIKVINNIIKDMNSDMWLYISRNYFKEKTKAGEVGSSTMPHKVNPINHENSMANIELANGIIDALVNNLSISRMQRDLTDSSKMRNLGVVLAHGLISQKQSLIGLNKLEVNLEVINEDLSGNFVVLTEAIQTVLRKNNIENAYELLKKLSRGKSLTQKEIIAFVDSLEISEQDKQTLRQLTPETYVGLAEKIVENN